MSCTKLPWPFDYPFPINCSGLIFPDNTVARHMDATYQLYPRSDFCPFSPALLPLVNDFHDIGAGARRQLSL